MTLPVVKFNSGWFIMKKNIMIVWLALVCFWGTAYAKDIIFQVPKEDYPPIHTIGEDGVPFGFSIDLAQAVCKEIGLTPHFVAAPWATLFDDVGSGKYVASAGATTITDARKQKVNFTDPYFEAEITVVVRQGTGYRKIKDLVGKNVGSWAATTMHDACRKISRFNDIRAVVPFPDTEASMRGLIQGQVDATFVDSPTAASYVFENPDYIGKIEIAFTLPSDVPDFFGFPVNKNEPELLNSLNKALKAVKSSGEYDRIYEKWFATMAKKNKGFKWGKFKFW